MAPGYAGPGRPGSLSPRTEPQRSEPSSPAAEPHRPSTSWVSVGELERWEDHGALWRTVTVTDELAVIDLCSCSGEPMERVQSETPELIEFVRSHRAGRED
jgi:hypothetical protein